MKLNISLKQEHTDIVSAVAWSPENQLASSSDDKVICKWGSDGEIAGKITSCNVFVSNISWFPSVGKQTPDLFAVSCTDGTFRFITKAGREDKKVSAHEGAVIVVRWSHDGSALVSAGEDGDIKIWSRSGNLRSTLVSTAQCVYCACWSPDDDQILFTSGKSLIIKAVQSNRKNLQWDAHDGIVLCVDWNVANKLIVSGGEDCTYRVWDSFGRMMYSSRRPCEHVITSVQWSPNGDTFAVGSFNTLRLCDKTGWTHCRERTQTGALLNISWTPDGTQLAAACGNGSVLFAQAVGRHFEWKNMEVTLTEPRKLRVEDVLNETVEDLEYSKDRVVEVGLGFDWLVVTTTTQCYVYATQNLNTPIIFDVRSPPHFVQLCKKHFLTLDQISGLQIINYEGRTMCSPKFQGLRAEYLTKDMVALSVDTVVVISPTDTKTIFGMDSVTGRTTTKISHPVEVLSVYLNQHSLGPAERILAFIDRNKDLFVCMVNVNSAPSSNSANAAVTYKLGANVDSVAFNDETDVLVGLSDGHIITWYQPGAAFIDKDLLGLTTTSSDATEFGRGAQISVYTASRVSIRKGDGAMLFSMTPAEIPLIYELARGGRWEECLRLCRHLKSNPLWGVLASFALSKRHLETAEHALSELNEVAKMEYIQFIREIPTEEGRQAELALFRRQPEDAERILLQATPPLVYRAIKMNITLYRWGRALDIAMKHRSHVDTVIGYRQRYLEQFGKSETEQKFIQCATQVKVDWELIDAKEQKEMNGSGADKK